MSTYRAHVPYPREGNESRTMYDVVCLSPGHERIATVSIELLDTTSPEVRDDDECPISMCPLRDAMQLDGRTTLWKGKGDLCIARLPCNHTFCTEPVLWHFAVNDMRCPVCRQGPYAKASLRSLPGPLRKRFRTFCTPPKNYRLAARVPERYQVVPLLPSLSTAARIPRLTAPFARAQGGGEIKLRVMMQCEGQSGETTMILNMQWAKGCRWITMQRTYWDTLRSVGVQLKCVSFKLQILDITRAEMGQQPYLLALSEPMPFELLNVPLLLEDGPGNMVWV